MISLATITEEERRRVKPYLRPGESLEQKQARVKNTILKDFMEPQSAPVSRVCSTCDDLTWVTHGVPVDHADFGKAFPCPVCQVPKLVSARMNAIIANSGLSPHHMYTFAEFWQLPDYIRQGKEEAARFAEQFANEKYLDVLNRRRYGLILWGKKGTGKTTLATSAVLAVANQGIPVLRVKYLDLLERIQSSYSAVQIWLKTASDGDQPPLTSEQIIDSVCKVPFLMIDELGDIKLEGSISPDKRNKIHRIIEYRLEYELPLMVTSNLNEALFYKQFSEPFGDRLFELCHKVEVTGQNLRT